MKRIAPLLAVTFLLTGCAHETGAFGGGGYAEMGAYPYAGLTECLGSVYGYDPYNPYLYDANESLGPCGGYGYRYYGYPYTYNHAPQAQQRQRIAALKRSNHPRVVAPRAADGSPSPSWSASGTSSS